MMEQNLLILEDFKRHPQFLQLDGSQGENRERIRVCQIEARNDYEAIQVWLAEYQHKPTTHRCYQKEAERLLLWSILKCGKALSSLTRADFEAYQLFLRDPQPREQWCGQKTKRGSIQWKPFVAPLSQSAEETAMIIINSLFGYLCEAGYLAFNPLNLMRRKKSYAKHPEEQKLQLQARILEDDEWQAIIEALLSMPEDTEYELFCKYRLKLIVYLFYFLGLRIHELVNHSWASLMNRQDKWWFVVKGKGDKWGKIPVNDELLLAIMEYRRAFKKTLLPQVDEHEPLITTWHKRARLGERRINSLLKELAIKAAQKFVDRPDKRKRLHQFSAHWLRHLSASMQDRAGIDEKIIQQNLRHERLETTRKYVHLVDDKRHEESKKLRLLL